MSGSTGGGWKRRTWLWTPAKSVRWKRLATRRHMPKVAIHRASPLPYRLFVMGRQPHIDGGERVYGRRLDVTGRQPYIGGSEKLYGRRLHPRSC